mmetsp:Transcript_34465/g.79555  ORF Transcript_34465/g.79555 Transcript_34465/m.79555 type:complete len:393 (-) Transcript_34465:107-1285(-)|eukprot:CAMPEP_0116825774 /NCGR_PEP_ID=MMETSP0418-20121206/2161_1 /TAXON_ID=1158023 /ORGANISM="Astrosyne radiata, Strain 13vi08-1A" /LENGTH=392 /DNA_ID=CAMNT_0004454337 /DNA_START=137 /DNA_END=1318 /DNA_ORIENTATION=-
MTASGSSEGRLGQWTELMGADLQLKVQTSPSGESAQVCDVGFGVYVNFVGKCVKNRDDTEDGPIFQEVKDWLVVVGDKDVTPALEMGIRFMKEGETGLVYSHSKFGYGVYSRTHGDYTLPPDSNLLYEVIVTKVVSSPKEFSSPKFQLEIAQNKKLMGNDCYQHEWPGGKDKALGLYQKGAETTSELLIQNDKNQEKGSNNDDAVRSQAQEILLDCLNNVAAVFLRAKEFGKAKEAATEVLRKDPNNVKALLRAARACMMDPGATFEESHAAILAAEEIDQDNADVKKLRAELERRKKEYNKKSRAMFSKMSEGMKVEKHAKTPPTEETLTTELEGDDSKFSGLRAWLWKYKAYILQLIMPLITLALFNMINRGSLPSEATEQLAPQDEGEF